MPRSKNQEALSVGDNLTPLGDNETTRFGSTSRMVAATIRLLRAAHGMSQPELEEKAGLAYGMISRIESGSRGRYLSVDVAVAIAKVFHLDLNWFLTGHGVVPFGFEGVEKPAAAPAPAKKARQKPARPRSKK